MFKNVFTLNPVNQPLLSNETPNELLYLQLKPSYSSVPIDWTDWDGDVKFGPCESQPTRLRCGKPLAPLAQMCVDVLPAVCGKSRGPDPSPGPTCRSTPVSL